MALQQIHRQYQQAQDEIQNMMKPLQDNLRAAAAQKLSESSSATLESSSATILLISLVVFLAQYAIAWSVCFRRWRGSKKLRACSTSIAFIHSVVASSLAAYDILTTPWILDAANSSFQNKIMEWSISFFLVDILHYMAAAPSELLFISHHLATLTYLLSCRFYSHSGAKSVMCLLFIGEMTTPIQSIWTLALLKRDDSRLAEKIYNGLSPLFTVAFTFSRGVLGPYLFWELFKLFNLDQSMQIAILGYNRNLIPKWLVLLWMIIVGVGILGSLLWGCKLWTGLLKFYLHRMRLFRSSSRRRHD